MIMGAVRQGRPKESGKRQFLISRLSKRFLPSLSQKWFDLKIEYLLWKTDKERIRQYKSHCKKGFHSLGRRVVVASYKGRVKRVEYLECRICEWKFFANVEDKNKFLKITSHKRSDWKKLLELNIEGM